MLWHDLALVSSQSYKCNGNMAFSVQLVRFRFLSIAICSSTIHLRINGSGKGLVMLQHLSSRLLHKSRICQQPRLISLLAFLCTGPLANYLISSPQVAYIACRIHGRELAQKDSALDRFVRINSLGTQPVTVDYNNPMECPIPSWARFSGSNPPLLLAVITL